MRELSCRGGLALAIVLATVAGRSACAQEVMPIEDLRLPLEHYDDGTLKAQLVAGWAKVPPRGAVEATDVRVELYNRDGSLSGTMQVEHCRYDRDTRRVTSDSKVRLERDSVVITGIGMEWDAEQETVRIRRDPKVVFKGTLKLKPGGMGQ